MTGAKPPLRPKHVWSIRTKLQIEGRARDLAMFNLAIDSSCVAAMSSPPGSRMSLPADTRRIVQRSDRRKPAGRSRFELSEQTRQAIDDYLKAANKRPGEFLFTGRLSPDASMTTPICAPRFRVDRQRSAGPKAIWDALATTHQSYPDLPAHGQS